MAVLSVALGFGLVLAIAVDLWLTVLHPSVRGPISYRVERAVWLAVRAAARASGRRGWLTFAGPAALLVNVLTWLAGLWVGYALVYLPYLDSGLSYGPTVAFGSIGLAEALYLSGVSLTTVGFGDVVAGTDVLRLVTVAEAASGFAVITGAISYVITVYPQVSVLRSAAGRLADAGADTAPGAARLVLQGGGSALGDLHHALVTVHQDFRRFPILYYFHAVREEESLVTLLRVCALVSMHLRWGIDGRRRDELAYYAAGLPTAVERTMESLVGSFVGGRGGRLPPGSDVDEPAARLQILRAAVAEVDAEAAATGSPPPGFEPFLDRCEVFLRALADRHEYPHRPLLD